MGNESTSTNTNTTASKYKYSLVASDLLPDDALLVSGGGALMGQIKWICCQHTNAMVTKDKYKCKNQTSKTSNIKYKLCFWCF